MKSLHKLFAIAVLTFVLTHAALGSDGIIHGDYIPTPTPTPMPLAPPAGDGGAPDDATTDSQSSATNATDITIEAVLSILGEVFAIY